MKALKLKLKLSYWEYTGLVGVLRVTLATDLHPLVKLILIGLNDAVERQFYNRFQANKIGNTNPKILTLTAEQSYALHNILQQEEPFFKTYFFELDRHLLNCGVLNVKNEN
jgi:hypothetical protein